MEDYQIRWFQTPVPFSEFRWKMKMAWPAIAAGSGLLA
jgi:hypothetical protein